MPASAWPCGGAGRGRPARGHSALSCRLEWTLGAAPLVPILRLRMQHGRTLRTPAPRHRPQKEDTEDAPPRSQTCTQAPPALSHLFLKTARQGHWPIVQMRKPGLWQAVPLSLNAALNLCCPQWWPDARHSGSGVGGTQSTVAPWRQLEGQRELPGWRRWCGPSAPRSFSPLPHPGGLGFSPDRLIS